MSATVNQKRQDQETEPAEEWTVNAAAIEQQQAKQQQYAPRVRWRRRCLWQKRAEAGGGVRQTCAEEEEKWCCKVACPTAEGNQCA